jgi:hypothetical protein
VKTAWLVVVLVSACGKKSSTAATDAVDWSRRPMVTVDGNAPVDGEKGPAYAIDLPQGLVADPGERQVFYWGDDRDSAPNVMVTIEDAPRTIDDALKAVYSEPDDKLVRKEALDHGFITTRRRARGWTIHVFRPIDAGKALMCRAEQYSDTAELGETTRTMLEKTCLSLRSK